MNDNLLLLSIAGDVDGAEIAEYYRVARNVPLENIKEVALDWVVTDGLIISDADYYLMIDKLVEFIPGFDCKTVLLCGNFPSKVSSTINSLSGFTRMNLEAAISRPFRQKNLGRMNDYTTESGSNKGMLPCFSHLLTTGYSHNPSTRTYVSGVKTVESDSQAGILSNIPIEPWKPNYFYNVNDICILGNNIYYSNNARCTRAGFSGSIEPTNGLSDVVDNDIIWDNASASKITVFPENYKLQGGYKTLSILGEVNQYRVGVMRLDSIEGVVGVKRMIDDAITAERLGRSDFSGNMILHEGSYLAGAPAYVEAEDKGLNINNIYHYQLDNEQSSMPEYTAPTVDKLYSINTTIQPEYNVAYTTVPNMDFIFLGQDAYYNGTNLPHTDSEMDYAVGSIAVFGQSYGCNPSIHNGMDTVNGTDNVLRVNNLSSMDALDTFSNFYYKDQYGYNTFAFRLRYLTSKGVALTSASAELTADNTLVLREDGLVVQTYNLTPNSSNRNISVEILTGLPNAAWDLGFAQGAESRCSRALRQGACIVAGSIMEPQNTNGANTSNLMNVLSYGGCIAEWQYAELSLISRQSQRSAETQMSVYGDPLYRPLIGRLGN